MLSYSRILGPFLLFGITLLFGCGKSGVFDASNEKAYKQSYARFIDQLPKEKSVRLELALARLTSTHMKKAGMDTLNGPVLTPGFLQQIDGKTPDQIIQLADQQRLQDQVR